MQALSRRLRRDRQFNGQHFDRHVSLQCGVVGSTDLAHAYLPRQFCSATAVSGHGDANVSVVPRAKAVRRHTLSYRRFHPATDALISWWASRNAYPETWSCRSDVRHHDKGECRTVSRGIQSNADRSCRPTQFTTAVTPSTRAHEGLDFARPGCAGCRPGRKRAPRRDANCRRVPEPSHAQGCCSSRQRMHRWCRPSRVRRCHRSGSLFLPRREGRGRPRELAVAVRSGRTPTRRLMRLLQWRLFSSLARHPCSCGRNRAFQISIGCPFRRANTAKFDRTVDTAAIDELADQWPPHQATPDRIMEAVGVNGGESQARGERFVNATSDFIFTLFRGPYRHEAWAISCDAVADTRTARKNWSAASISAPAGDFD